MRGVVRFLGWSFVLSVLLWKFSPMLGFDVSRFPGTLTFQSGTYGIQVPVLFCLLVSAGLTGLGLVVRKLRR